MNIWILFGLLFVLYWMSTSKKEGFIAAPGIKGQLATKPSDRTANYDFDFNNLDKYNPDYWDLYHTTPDPPFETIRGCHDCGSDKYNHHRRLYVNDTKYFKFNDKRNIIKQLVPANYSDLMYVSDAKFENNYRITNPNYGRFNTEQAFQPWNYFWEDYKDVDTGKNTEPKFENRWLRGPYKLRSTTSS
jgi:hypothetical protein